MRSLLLLFFGVGLGAFGVFLLGRTAVMPSTSQAPEMVSPQVLRCESELARERAKVATLENRVAQQPAGVSPSGHEHSQVETQHTQGDFKPADERAVSWQISAIEKFVPLSDDQKDKLRGKFLEEREARREGRESSAESLDAIIGEASAAAYRQQVQSAFERVQNAELEKETVWLSRQLALSDEQERGMRSVFAEVEAQVRAQFGGAEVGNKLSAQERVSRLLAENKKRTQLRAEGLQKILNADQQKRYAEQQAQSPDADMEIFHDSGE